MADLRRLYQDDPPTLKKINTYEAQIESSKKTLSKSDNTITLTKHALDKTISDRPDILDIVDKGKAERERLFGPQLPEKVMGHDHDGDGIPDH